MTAAPTTPPTGPAAAERARSILAGAESLDIVSSAGRARLHGRHSVRADAELSLRVEADSRLATLASQAPDGTLEVAVELTDVATAPVRSRVRAQLTLNARLTLVGLLRGPDADPAGTATMRVRPSCGRLIENSAYTFVDGHQLAAATPDPLAPAEAALLMHLADAHQQAVDLLARLVPRDLLHGVRTVHPLRLDRFGVTLRLEHPRTDRDVRLRFPAPVRDQADAGDQIRALLNLAQTCRRHRTGH